jgi:hypothetical protein
MSVEKETEQRLRRLAVKWMASARHPMRANRPEERDLLIRCAAELQQEIHAERGGVKGPRRSCCPTQPGESHLGTCSRSVMHTVEWNE